jgi:hypothetical protein
VRNAKNYSSKNIKIENLTEIIDGAVGNNKKNQKK